MEDLMFYRSWEHIWMAIGASGDGTHLRNELMARYSESYRHYHTLQHLKECLQLLHELKPQPENAITIELALWFHDAVYDVTRHDNEEQSACLAREHLKNANVSEKIISTVTRLVLATRHNNAPENADEALITDIDLAILGAPEPRFAEYTQQIRQEYAFVLDAIFNKGRYEVLQAFLNRPGIYNTDAFKHRFEKSAQLNLKTALGNVYGLD